MKKYIFRYWPLVFIFTIWIVFSSPFFFKGLVPFPSNYQASFFAPWSAYSIYQGPVKNNAMPDIITQIYPWRNFTIESLKSGSIPLWNPYSFSGTPHLANYQSAPFFPLNLLFFLPFKFIDMWSVFILLQPLLAGIGMYLFLRNQKLEIVASLFGSISFMFCGFVTSWMAYGTLGYAILFLPLMLFSLDKFLERKKIIYGIILSILIASSLFAGHFQTSIYLILAVFGYILFIFIRHKNLHDFLLLLLFFASGILMAMPQILPSIEFYMNSVRQVIVTRLEVIPLSYLPTFFAPDYYGNPVTRNDWFGHYAEWNGYAGVSVLVFAIFASIILWMKDKRVIYFGLLLIFSFLLAFDTPLNLLVFNLKLPLLSTSASSRIIVLSSFSLAVLAAYGLDYILKSKKLLVKQMIVLTVLSLGLLTIFWAVPILDLLPDAEKNQIAKSNMRLPSILLLILLFSLFLNYIFHKLKYRRIVISILILSIITIDMLRFSTKWIPFDPHETVFKETGVSRFYLENKSTSRYLAGFTAENSVFYKIQSLGGYDPLYPGRYGEFVRYIASGQKLNGERSVVNFPINAENTSKALNFLGVEFIPQKKSDDGKSWGFNFSNYPEDQFKIVYEDDSYRVFKNLKSFPRAFVVTDYKVARDDIEILQGMFSSSINLRNIVFLEEDPKISTNDSNKSEVVISEYNPNRIVLKADSDNEGILVLTDNYYPGWKAYVNGVDAKILRSNYSFRGVVIPRGESIIEFKYKPDSFYNGIYLMIIGMGILLVIVVISNKNERKN